MICSLMSTTATLPLLIPRFDSVSQQTLLRVYCLLLQHIDPFSTATKSKKYIYIYKRRERMFCFFLELKVLVVIE